MSDQPPGAPTEAVPTDGGPIYCRSCGAEVELGSQFCGKCGTPTRATEADPTMVAPVVPAEPLRRTTVVDEPGPYVEEPMTVVRSADNWWSGPFIFMAAAILVVLIVVLAVALSRDGPTTTTTTTVTVPPTVATTAATAPIIVPAPPPPTPAPTAAPPVIINNPPPQQAPPQTTASTTSSTTTTEPQRP